MHKRIIALRYAFEGALPKFTPSELSRVQVAMENYAVGMLLEYKSEEMKGEVKSFFKLMLQFTRDNAMLYMRYRVFKFAKRQAQLRANTENYKVYVIRESNIRYKVLSTIDVQFNKRIRVLGKDVTAKDLHEIADFVAYPVNLKYK